MSHLQQAQELTNDNSGPAAGSGPPRASQGRTAQKPPGAFQVNVVPERQSSAGSADRTEISLLRVLGRLSLIGDRFLLGDDTN